MRFGLLLAAFVSTFFLFSAAPGNAQATRTWVSGVGDDANPCSRTAPCKTFAGAISKTASGGEINAIDPGGFGAVTITKSITIRCDGVTCGVLASGTNGLVVNLPSASDTVVLQGLDIEGVGVGLNGIRMIGGGRLHVFDTMIRNFKSGTGFGIDIAGTNGARVFVEDVQIVNNTGGINVAAASGANSLFLMNSVIDRNDSFGVNVTSPSAAVIGGSILTGNAGFDLQGSGTSLSFGNNVIRTGTPTQTTQLK